MKQRTPILRFSLNDAAGERRLRPGDYLVLDLDYTFENRDVATAVVKMQVKFFWDGEVLRRVA